MTSDAFVTKWSNGIELQAAMELKADVQNLLDAAILQARAVEQDRLNKARRRSADRQGRVFSWLFAVTFALSGTRDIVHGHGDWGTWGLAGFGYVFIISEVVVFLWRRWLARRGQS